MKLDTILSKVPEEIKAQMCPMHYDKGRYILRAGESNDYLYILTEGSSEVCMQTHQGITLSIETHHAPDSFGILEIINQDLKTKSVIAKTDCTIISLHKPYVLKWMSMDFDFNLYICHYLTECFRHANAYAHVLSTMTLKERVLHSIYQHYITNTLSSLTKEIILQEIRAPKRSLNRVILECSDEGIFKYENKHFILLDESKLYGNVSLYT